MSLAKQKEENPDVAELMKSIRADVKSQSSSADDKADSSEESSPASVLYSEELNYLNANWSNWAESVEITSHRKFFGPIIVRLKRAFVNLVWEHLLKGYFDRERQFQLNLVNYLNKNAKYIDKRDSDIFWELIHKVDDEVLALNERVELSQDASLATIRSLTNELKADIISSKESLSSVSKDSLSSQHLESLKQRVADCERLVASLGTSPESSPEARVSSDELTYRIFENNFRGSEEELKKHVEQYLDFFKNADGKVLDIGCGRGEFLELLKSAKVDSVGIDINQSMVDRCLEKGLEAVCVDCFEYLEGLEDNALSGVFTAQLVEHLSSQQIDTLVKLISKKVKPGGVVILETINPTSVVALSNNFYRDPTHQSPVHPETLKFLMDMAGFESEIKFVSEVSSEAKLQPIEKQEFLPPRWNDAISKVNQNIERLNSILFGHQDFAIVAKRKS